jgi:hypothetical protein
MKVAFLNFKEEQGLQAGITTTINPYSKEQIASLTGYNYIINTVKQATFAMEAR